MINTYIALLHRIFKKRSAPLKVPSQVRRLRRYLLKNPFTGLVQWVKDPHKSSYCFSGDGIGGDVPRVKLLTSVRLRRRKSRYRRRSRKFFKRILLLYRRRLR